MMERLRDLGCHYFVVGVFFLHTALAGIAGFAVAEHEVVLHHSLRRAHNLFDIAPLVSSAALLRAGGPVAVDLVVSAAGNLLFDETGALHAAVLGERDD